MKSGKGPRKMFQSVIKGVLNMVLLAATSYFLWDMMKVYLEENTYFSVTSKPVTKIDLPTLTVCLKSKNENGTQL